MLIRSALFLVLSFSSAVIAAPWLFGSGLLGLVGVARHKKANQPHSH
jgi:hypothetical protein